MLRHNERGVATIEATLILPMFMAIMILFISYANLATIEMRMQYAVNQTAKEISEYYYVAYKFGLNYSGASGNDDVDTMIESLVSLKATGEQAVSNLNVDELSNDLSTLASGNIDMTSAQRFVSDIKSNFNGNNPIDILKTLVAAFQNVKTAAGNVGTDDLLQLGGNTVGAILTTVIAEPLSAVVFPKYLAGDDTDRVLKNWGIEGGMDDLQFGASSFLLDGQTIQVVVMYKVELFSLGFWDFDMTMCQVGSTRAWIGDAKDIKGKTS